jgi:hypothetical protein
LANDSTTIYHLFLAPLFLVQGLPINIKKAFHVTASESAAVRITFFLVWQRHSAVLPVLCTSSLKSLKLFVSLQRRGRKLQRVATMPTLQNLSPRRNTLDPPLGSGWWWSHPSQKNCMEKCEKSH